MLLAVPVEPLSVVVVVLEPVSVPVVPLVPVSVPVPVVPVSVPVSPSVSVAVPVAVWGSVSVDVVRVSLQGLSPETVYVAPYASNESSESSVELVTSGLGAVVTSAVPPVPSELEELEELLTVVFKSAVPPGFDSPHAVSAIPSVIPSVASEPPRAVPHGAWQKGQAIVPSIMCRSQARQKRMQSRSHAPPDVSRRRSWPRRRCL